MRDMMEETHYVHTLIAFNKLLRDYGHKQVLKDLKTLDLTNYEKLVTMVRQADEIDRQTSVLLKDPFFKTGE